MTHFEITSPARAFVGIGLVVLAADGELSQEEANSVFDSLQSLDIFAGRAGFGARHFIGELMVLSHSFLVESRGVPPDEDALAFSEEMVDGIISAAGEVLDPELRERAIPWAVELAFADGFDAREGEMLYRVAQGLGLDADVVDRAVAAQE
jgi:hypothetical protein